MSTASLPWKTESITTLEPGEQRATLRIIGSTDNNVGGELVCDLNEGWGNHDANAGLIVRAVNSHAELLAALQKVEEIFHTMAFADRWPLECAIDEVTKAIITAGGTVR